MKKLSVLLLCLLGWAPLVLANNSAPALSYEFSSPYDGAAKLTITNHTKELVYLYQSVKGIFPIVGLPDRVVAHLGEVELLLPIAGACSSKACLDPTPGKRIMGYYTDWDMYARKYPATDIPINKLNTIIYAFIGYDTSGDIHLLDPYSDQKQIPSIATMLKQYPYLNAYLSFGGWSMSYDFTALASDANARVQFASQAVQAMKQVGFNGIDIDWEFPVSNGAPGEPAGETPQDAANFAALLKDVREALDKQGALDGTHYDLSIAVSPAPDKITAVTRANASAWQQIANTVDYLNLMSYDLHGAFDMSQPAPYNVSNFQAAMEIDPINDPNINHPVLSTYSITDAVDGYLDVGFEPQQIVLGVPAYGRMMNVAQVGDSQGLYQTITGIPAGEYDDWSGNTGVFNYRCIVDSSQCYSGSASHLAGLQLVNPNTNPYGQYAKTPWGYRVDQPAFITYDDAESTAYKSRWVKDKQLGGVMFWALSGDLPAQQDGSLVRAAYEELK